MLECSTALNKIGVTLDVLHVWSFKAFMKSPFRGKKLDIIKPLVPKLKKFGCSNFEEPYE